MTDLRDAHRRMNLIEKTFLVEVNDEVALLHTERQSRQSKRESERERKREE